MFSYFPDTQLPENKLKIETNLKTQRSKEAAVLLGFVYTLKQPNRNTKRWTCQNRECNGSITTDVDEFVVKIGGKVLEDENEIKNKGLINL